MHIIICRPDRVLVVDASHSDYSDLEQIVLDYKTTRSGFEELCNTQLYAQLQACKLELTPPPEEKPKQDKPWLRPKKGRNKRSWL